MNGQTESYSDHCRQPSDPFRRRIARWRFSPYTEARREETLNASPSHHLPTTASLGLVLAALLALPACRTAERPLSDDEIAALPGSLVFTSERDGTRGAYRMAFGAETVRISGPEDEVALAVSPDGQAVVVGRTVEAERGPSEQLVLREGDSVRVITPASGRARNPAWSPDGRWFAFEADLDAFSDIYRADRATGAVTRLTAEIAGNYEPAVSPDGAQIIFVSSRDHQAEVYRMAPDGADPTRLPASPRDEWAPRWSPDGSRVTTLSTERGRDELFVMNPDGTARRRLNATREDGGTAEVLEGEPAWSPDGRALAYLTRARSGATQIWTVDVASGAHRPLTGPDDASYGPTFSPDGRWIAFVSERDGDPEVYVARADGSRPTRLTRARGPDWGLLWAP